MTTLEKLKAIEEKKVIYNICYRVAGVGIMFYDESRLNGAEGPGRALYDGWEKGLYVDKYYPTFEQAVDAEYARL